MNVYQKLIEARERFLGEDVSKSGKNPNLEFKYFELKDIVPPVTRIFKEIGLVALTEFTETEAILHVVNTENPEESITFRSPMRFVEPNRGTNPLMALGASHTYMRRYMYMLAMDVCEPDAIDGGIIQSGEDTGVAAAPAPKKSSKRKAPATPKERDEIKDVLTAPGEPASELQIQGLIDSCNALLDKDPGQEEFVQEIAVKTDSFQNLTKDDCEKIVNAINDMLAQYEG